MSGFGGLEINGPLQIPSPESLRVLNLDSNDKVSAFVAGFVPRKLEHLTHLSIQAAADSAEIFELLARCPRLEALVVKSFTPQSAAAHRVGTHKVGSILGAHSADERRDDPG
jgi:hypothetical protein